MTLTREDFRPLLHLATGLVALGMGVYPRWFLIGGAVGGVVIGWVVMPLSPLEAKLRRPSEPFVNGLRTYPLAVLGLVLLLPTTLAAIAWGILAAGDAAASLIGRRVSSAHVFGHKKATWVGSTAFLVVATAVGLAFGHVVSATGGSPMPSALRVALASLAATLIDLVPIPPDDNLPHAAAAGLVLALAPV